MASRQRLAGGLAALSVCGLLGACGGSGTAAPSRPPLPVPQSATSSSLATAPTAPTSVRPGRPHVIATGLAVPWGLAFLPDGSALVSERDSHRIVRVTASGPVRSLGTVPGVADDTAEGGLLGLALSPGFAHDHLVYAYLTSAGDNRIVRFTLAGGRIGTPQPVFTGIPRAAIHDGGRIAFGPDGMLYVTTGDATASERAQDRDYLGGKVLRMTPDGKPAPGNPFADSVVYTLGHRNPQGLAWGPGENPPLYEAEFGQNREDEVNQLRPGHDYGWPIVEGTLGPKRPGFTAPLVTWPTDQASPSGLAYAGGSLWLATLQGRDVYRIPVLGPGRLGQPVALLQHEYGRLRTIARAPDGSLWVTTSNRDGRGSPQPGDDRIIRIPLG